MKLCFLFISVCVLSYGCASTKPEEMPDKLPRLVEQEPFPPMSEGLSKTRHDFDLRLQIGEDGTVLRAELMSPSGDAEWDSLALKRIEKWKFSPAMQAGKPLRIWISIRACVRCAEPLKMGLREIVCANSLLADSVYALLLAGEDFGKLVSKFSISKSKVYKGDLGEVDIHRYSEEVQKTLLHLGENEFTKPLAMGEQFAIFQRIVWDVRLQ